VLAGAGAGGWSGVRGKYCWAGAGASCRTQWMWAVALEGVGAVCGPATAAWVEDGQLRYGCEIQ